MARKTVRFAEVKKSPPGLSKRLSVGDRFEAKFYGDESPRLHEIKAKETRPNGSVTMLLLGVSE